MPGKTRESAFSPMISRLGQCPDVLTPVPGPFSKCFQSVTSRSGQVYPLIREGMPGILNTDHRREGRYAPPHLLSVWFLIRSGHIPIRYNTLETFTNLRCPGIPGINPGVPEIVPETLQTRAPRRAFASRLIDPPSPKLFCTSLQINVDIHRLAV